MKNYTERFVSNFNKAAIELLPLVVRTALVAAVIPLLIGILVQDAGVIVDPLESLHNLQNWIAASMIYPLATTGVLVTAFTADVAVFTAVTRD